MLLIVFDLLHCFIFVLLLFIANVWSIYTLIDTHSLLDPSRQLRTLTLVGQHFDLHVADRWNHVLLESHCVIIYGAWFRSQSAERSKVSELCCVYVSPDMFNCYVGVFSFAAWHMTQFWPVAWCILVCGVTVIVHSDSVASSICSSSYCLQGGQNICDAHSSSFL